MDALEEEGGVPSRLIKTDAGGRHRHVDRHPRNLRELLDYPPTAQPRPGPRRSGRYFTARSTGDPNRWAAERLARELGWVLDAALRETDTGVFAAHLDRIRSDQVAELRLGKKTDALRAGHGAAQARPPRAELDRLAAKLWAGAAGRDNWVCASLVDA